MLHHHFLLRAMGGGGLPTRRRARFSPCRVKRVDPRSNERAAQRRRHSSSIQAPFSGSLRAEVSPQRSGLTFSQGNSAFYPLAQANDSKRRRDVPARRIRERRRGQHALNQRAILGKKSVHKDKVLYSKVMDQTDSQVQRTTDLPLSNDGLYIGRF